MESLVASVKELLALSEPEKALSLLSQHQNDLQYTEDPRYLQILGETLVENSQIEEAMAVYSQLVSAHPDASEALDGYFNIAQIIGGQDGIASLEKGLQLAEKLPESAVVVLKCVKALFLAVEIYMTELCYEEDAQNRCKTYLEKAVSMEPNNPEAWSLHASYLVSAMEPEEAKSLVNKAWELFSEKKRALEDSGDLGGSPDANSEYIELIQPMMALAKTALDAELFETAAEVALAVHDIEEELLEPYYIEAFSYYMAAKALQYNKGSGATESGPERLEKLLAHSLDLQDPEVQDFVRSALLALSQGLALVYLDTTCDDEVKAQVKVLVEELGGRQAMKKAEKEAKIDVADDVLDEIE